MTVARLLGFALASTLVLIMAMTMGAVAASVRPVVGHIVLARDGVQATYMWDATTYVAQLVADKDLGEEGMRALEASAVTALADKARNSRAKTLVLEVIYSTTGDVSPVYRAATFSHVERVCTLTAERRDILRHSRAWTQSVAGGRIPAELKVVIIGKLPPQ